MEIIVIVLVLLAFSGFFKRKKPISYQFLRGTRLTPSWKVCWLLRRWQHDRNTLVWGRHRVPLSVATQHFLVAGTTRSGKTVTLRLLMQSVFPRIGQGESWRAFVYDGKGDLLPVLRGIKKNYQRLITFDPFSVEGFRWAIAMDVTDDATANQVANLLFPKQAADHQPFFPESLINFAASIMQVFVEIALGEWRLSHLLFVLRSPERIKAVLSITAKGRDTLEQFVHSGETWANISATISNRIRDYEVVAALHDHAKQSFSMKEWNEEESILILQKSSFCPEVMDALNRVLFTLAKRSLLSKPPSPRRRTWMIFDELASIKSKEMSKDLGLLLEQGASRNVSVALGFQNISAVRDEFGDHGANRLIALCSNKAILRAEDYVSAEWSSSHFGKQEVRAINTSSNHSSGAHHSSGETTSYQDQERWVVQPSEFLALPLPVGGTGVVGFFALPLNSTTLFKDRLPAKWLFNGKTLTPEADHVVVERPASQQRLSTTEADIEKLLKGRVRFSSALQSENALDNSEAREGGIAETIPTTAVTPSTVTPTAVTRAEPHADVVPAPVASTNLSRKANQKSDRKPKKAATADKSVRAYAAANANPDGAPPSASVTRSPDATGETFNPTNMPEVWDLTTGTTHPASIWSVDRTT